MAAHGPELAVHDTGAVARKATPSHRRLLGANSGHRLQGASESPGLGLVRCLADRPACALRVRDETLPCEGLLTAGHGGLDSPWGRRPPVRRTAPCVRKSPQVGLVARGSGPATRQRRGIGLGQPSRARTVTRRLCALQWMWRSPRRPLREADAPNDSRDAADAAEVVLPAFGRSLR